MSAPGSGRIADPAVGARPPGVELGRGDLPAADRQHGVGCQRDVDDRAQRPAGRRPPSRGGLGLGRCPQPIGPPCAGVDRAAPGAGATGWRSPGPPPAAVAGALDQELAARGPGPAGPPYRRTGSSPRRPRRCPAARRRAARGADRPARRRRPAGSRGASRSRRRPAWARSRRRPSGPVPTTRATSPAGRPGRPRRGDPAPGAGTARASPASRRRGGRSRRTAGSPSR